MTCSRFAMNLHRARLPLLGALFVAFVAAAPQAASAFSEDEDDPVQCLAISIYFEARGEPPMGQLAVGHVVMNRVEAEEFPDDVCAVVRDGGEWPRFRCQFTWWCDGRSDRVHDEQAWQRSLVIARAIYEGHTVDPTGGALWYHADYVKPEWSDWFEQGPFIGRHVFYRRAGTQGGAQLVQAVVRDTDQPAVVQEVSESGAQADVDKPAQDRLVQPAPPSPASPAAEVVGQKETVNVASVKADEVAEPPSAEWPEGTDAAQQFLIMMLHACGSSPMQCSLLAR